MEVKSNKDETVTIEGQDGFRLEMLSAKRTMVEAIKQFVLTYGENFSDYYRDEMGIDDEENGEATVCRVIDIFNNGGCYFPYTMSVTVNERAFWQFYAFQCLYVVKEGDKMEVKAYALVNDGNSFNSDEAEPDHDSLMSYDLDVITKLYYWLVRIFGEK